MPSITPNTNTVELTPAVYVTVGGVLLRSLVAETVTITPTGATATIAAPLLVADSDKTFYYQNEIAIYVEENQAPIFRGYIDVADSTLRGDSVVFTARSVWHFLRNVKIFTPGAYNVQTMGGLTTQASPILYILADNPYTDAYESRVWQPAEIIAAAVSRLDLFWQSKATFWTDPRIPAIQPIEQTVYRMKHNVGSGRPSMQTVTRTVSPFPEIVLRESTTIGEVMDLVSEMAPGTQVFEVFSNVGTDIYLAYPSSFGAIIGTAGIVGEDWRDVGANVKELTIETSNGAAVNRVVAPGAQASCIVTLFSETGAPDDDERNMITGLVPDWNFYVGGTTVSVKGLQGAAAYNYDDECTYAFDGTYPQTVDVVLDNPNVGKPGQPEYIKGYEHVGRRYRLPNWFEFADIETKGDLITDQRTGQSVKVQAFFEAAVFKGKSVGEDPYDFYKYVWFETKDFIFDQRTRTVTFGELLITDYIGKVGDQLWQLRPDKGKKLCRVALTFTYSNPQYTMVCDSYLDAGSVLPQFTETAITTGQTYTLPADESLGFTQITNINMPCIARYGEWVSAGEMRVIKTPLAAPRTVVYDNYLLAATTSDSPNTYDASGIIAAIDQEFGQDNPGLTAKPTLPIALRDDSARLRNKCYQTLYRKLRKPRVITAEFNQLVSSARRGMQLMVYNINGLDSFYGDNINQVTHDLVRGFTEVRTTNQLADDHIDVTIG